MRNFYFFIVVYFIAISVNVKAQNAEQIFFRATALSDGLEISKAGESVLTWQRVYGLKIFSLTDYKLLKRHAIQGKDMVYASFKSEDEAYLFTKDTSGYYLSELNFKTGAETSLQLLPIPKGNFDLWFSAKQKFLIAEQKRVNLTDTIETFIFNFETMELVKKLNNSLLENLNGANITPDEKNIVVLNFSSKITIIDIESDEKIKEEIIDYFPPNSKPKFSFDGKYLLIAQINDIQTLHSSKYVYVYNYSDLTAVDKIESSVIYNFIPSNDKQIVYITKHDTLSVYNLDVKEEVFRIELFGIKNIDDYTDRICVHSFADCLSHWSFDEKKEMNTISLRGGNWGFSPESDRLFTHKSESYNYQIVSYDFDNWDPGNISTIEYNENEKRLGQTRYIADDTDTSSIVVKDFIDNQVVYVKDMGFQFPTGFRLTEDLKYIQLYKYFSSPNGSYLKVIIKNFETLETVFEYDSINISSIHYGTYTFSPSNKYIAGFELGRAVPVFAVRLLNTGEEVFTFAPDSIKRICFSEDEKSIYLKLANQTIEKYDILTGELLQKFDSAGSAIKTNQRLNFAEVNNMLVDATGEKQVNIWNIHTGEKCVLDWYSDVVLYKSFISPDKKLLAVSDKEGTTAVWNIENVFTSVDKQPAGGNSEIEVFPQPASESVVLNFNTGTNEYYTVSIFDIHGKAVYETKGSSTNGNVQMQINISNLPSGIYLARVISGKNVICGKILKN